MKLRKDDPIYYKAAMNELLKEAEINNIKVYLKEPLTTIGHGLMLMFESDNEEKAGVKIEIK